MRKLLLCWAISWTLAACMLALHLALIPPDFGCFDCTGWGGTPDPYPALTSVLTLFAPPAGSEVFPAMLPPFALALLALLIIKRLRAKRRPSEDAAEEP